MHGIKLSNMTYHYDKIPMFNNINLQIPVQSVTCLVGANGSGKSTLLKLMGGLIRNYIGTILLDNISIHSYMPKSLAKKLAYLPQQCQIPPSLTVREYVALGRFCHQSWFSNLQNRDRVSIEEAIALTDLYSMANQPVSILSVGQQQRARIALMLAQQAEYLLLDEPMTGLDLKQQRNMLDLFVKLQKNYNKTIIVILHDLHQVMEIASNVILLKNSNILGQGHPRDIINADFLFKTFDYECEISNIKGDMFYIVPKKVLALGV